MVVTPTIVAGTVTNFVFTFTASGTFAAGSQITLQVPTGWTVPTTSPGAGQVDRYKDLHSSDLWHDQREYGTCQHYVREWTERPGQIRQRHQNRRCHLYVHHEKQDCGWHANTPRRESDSECDSR